MIFTQTRTIARVIINIIVLKATNFEPWKESFY